MCGIGGILFSPKPRENLERRAARMRHALRLRGPDASGVWSDPSAWLVHTRLAVLDLATGEQPMTDPTGRYVLVFNGELYNHHQLRQELSGRYAFRTRSDTETLLASYVVWGEECLARLNGMFAFFLWDGELRRGFAARDPLGVKPFVHAWHEGEFLFASEAKALLAQWEGRPALDLTALVEGLVVPGFSGVRRSMFQGLEHLPAGHKLIVDQEGVRSSAYFRYHVAREEELQGPEERAGLVATLRTRVEESVARTLLADVPLGVFLSGGLDSTALTTLAARRTSEPLTAFTIRFEAHEHIDFGRSPIVVGDDAPYVEELGRTLPLRLERVVASQQEQLRELDALAAVDDRLLVWEQEYVQYVLARAASQHRKVVLVGDAADETHFGYFWFLDGKVNHGPRGLMGLFGAEQRAACLSRTLREELQPLALLEGEYLDFAARAGYSFSTPAERIRAVTYLITTLWLGRLLHNGDIMTMAHGLEARVPFADVELLQVAQRIPASLGFAGGQEKSVLREAVRPFVPDPVFFRKKSALPRDPRLGPLYQRALLVSLEEDAAFAREYLDVEEVRRLCALPSPTDIERTILFSLLALFRWQRHHLR